MTTTPEHDQSKSVATQTNTGGRDEMNPRDTDHPTGSEQAAENDANDPPS